MGDLSSLPIWREPDLEGRMPWYRAVADNRRPAKFRIARYIPVEAALDAPEEALWRELDAKTPLFLELATFPRTRTMAEWYRRERWLRWCGYCGWRATATRSVSMRRLESFIDAGPTRRLAIRRARSPL